MIGLLELIIFGTIGYGSVLFAVAISLLGRESNMMGILLCILGILSLAVISIATTEVQLDTTTTIENVKNGTGHIIQTTNSTVTNELQAVNYPAWTLLHYVFIVFLVIMTIKWALVSFIQQ